ncbi:pyrimidine reductase family protein [Mycolicibacterium vaccae]|uniref:Bacterial bifunctional deaminase-reductase C-terminal domain-containing protein n=3 Tax=Mycolicibacterium vaccae TaxID=1810 RepID=K0UZ09_MYCVA|nr:pyrimidine reductase family protein [Mycolicibacterium vaccae]ANI41663.1 hypothetical protein MYVA_4585 [Mycolicibacterium vaccae 95051]EJZ12011.1 hypothetical protein MVAC_03706 [Mycolicibacterium vaccae ATCC 25954]
MTEVTTLVPGDAAEDHGYRPAPPGVRANMIFSADASAAFGGRAGPLSCPTDYRLLLALRAYADVVLVGAGTARAEGYGPVRLRAEHRAQRRELGLGDDPPPIAVVSRSGRLPETLFDSPVRPILVTSATGRTDEPRCDVIVSGDDTVDIAHAIGELKRRGMHRILCEGGPTLLDELVTADLVDELCVTLAPRLAGHQPVGRSAPAGLTEPTDMTLERLLVDPGGFLYLRYARS